MQPRHTCCNLSSNPYLCACPTHRLTDLDAAWLCAAPAPTPLPPSQGNALDMLEDVNTGIAWVLRKLERYGGDPERVWLVGQSAGGQLAMLALLNQAAQAATGEAVWGGAPVWHPQGLAGFVGVSEWRHWELVPAQQGTAHIHACVSSPCVCSLLVVLWA